MQCASCDYSCLPEPWFTPAIKSSRSLKVMRGTHYFTATAEDHLAPLYLETQWGKRRPQYFTVNQVKSQDGNSCIWFWVLVILQIFAYTDKKGVLAGITASMLLIGTIYHTLLWFSLWYVKMFRLEKVLLLSQLVPSKPFRHLQKYPPNTSPLCGSQMPSFLQGFGWQGPVNVGQNMQKNRLSDIRW